MILEFSPDFVTAGNRELHNLPSAEKPLIKILLYTDEPKKVMEESVNTFGLGLMISQLKSHPPAFANLCVKLKSRYPIGRAQPVERINAILDEECKTGHPFDQIWFFGIHKVNKRDFRFGINGGGPDSELNADEITKLRTCMDNGVGVLITGDHANLQPIDALPPDPNAPCPDKVRLKAEKSGEEIFLGLGRALGRCVPRAGQLRDWEGSPTSREDDSNNTQIVTFGLFGDRFNAQIIFESDRVPQQLILQTFDEKGNRARRGQPHPLFFYRPGRWIQLFPDHLHEGAVVIPKEFDGDLWPKNDACFQPLPCVVAYGLDKRNGRKLKLVAAYDGAAAGVGRIVADSTWHHYFNINLSEFASSSTNPAADQIGQYYGNLALWLSSSQKRFEMADAMFEWLAQRPEVLEELSRTPTTDDRDILKAGAAALRILTQVASPCEIHELLQAAIPKTYCEPSGTLYLPERGFALSHLPSKELLLGHIINQHPWETLENLGPSLTADTRRRAISDAFISGSVQAFENQSRLVSQIADFAQKFCAQAYLKTMKLSEVKDESE